MAKPKFTIQPVQATKPVVGVDRELLVKTVDDGVYPLAMAKEIRLDRIQPDPNQPRRTFDQEKLAELAASISEHGVLQPIVVEYVDDGDYFLIVSGERRYRACQMANQKNIPAIVRQADDPTRLARQLIENIQREDLNDVDRALALKQLKVNLGSPSWEVVAQKVGISKRRILQLMDTTKLPASVQQGIRAGELTEKHGRAIKKLPAEQQVDFARAIRAQGLSGDESIQVAKFLATEPQATITEAILEVQTSKAADAQAKKTRNKTTSKANPASDVMEPTPATVSAIETDVPDLAQQNDPLAAIAMMPQTLQQVDLDRVDPLALQNLLRQVIARAEDLLAQITNQPNITADL